MSETAPPKHKPGLTAAAFEQLLRALDEDRERAGARYEALRQKLLKFFAWEHCAFPEEQADETLKPLGAKLAAGTGIHDLNAYCYGIARLVLLETRKTQKRTRAALDQLSAAPVVTPDTEASEQLSACFEQCLQGLPPEAQQFILAYYRGDKGALIAHRQRLAEQLDIPLNALRNRALRLRDKLEACVRNCLNSNDVARDESAHSATNRQQRK